MKTMYKFKAQDKIILTLPLLANSLDPDQDRQNANSLDPDQDLCSVGPDLGPNCLQKLLISRRQKTPKLFETLLVFLKEFCLIS